MIRIASIVAFAAAIAGCASVPETITQQSVAVNRQQPVVAAPASGAIFHAGAYRPMFEDRRARLAGDTLIIAINERTSAGKSAANSGTRNSGVDYSMGGLLGLSASTLARASASADGSNKFEEKGAASSSNNFSGTIAATVIDVLPNGNLLVAGEKQVAFDKGVEYVRFSGVVNPSTIAPGNVVPSTQVADARLEYRTNSRVDKAELMSQLARFFLSLAPL